MSSKPATKACHQYMLQLHMAHGIRGEGTALSASRALQATLVLWQTADDACSHVTGIAKENAGLLTE
jgi:hypothetical protein